MPTTMCDLATRLPLLIGLLLDREAKLNRGRFREETMTDIFTGALAAFAGPELVIQYPIEADTGGDIDLRFWNVETNRDLNLRIQAKRLNAAFDNKKPVKVAHRSYRELLHKPPTAADYQYQTLAATPPPFVPLYMFYNHHSVVNDPFFAGASPAVSGVNLAFAIDIAEELTAKVDAAQAKPKTIKHHKRLSHLRSHLFGLEAILCPGGDWDGAGVPPPDAVSSSLRVRWTEHDEGAARSKGENLILRILSEPSEMTPGPDPARRIPDGPSIRIDQTVERPVVTFISGRTDDGRTPTITDVLDPRQP